MLLAIVLVIVGLALVVAEVFFVSMGMLSLLAGVCILGADMLAFQEGPTAGWTLVAAEIVLVPLLIWLAFKALPHLPFGRRMLLTGPVSEPTGGFQGLERFVGMSGKALTDLRPAGTAVFGEERVTVVGLGGYIPRGSDVVAVSVEGPELKVRATRVPDEE